MSLAAGATKGVVLTGSGTSATSMLASGQDPAVTEAFPVKAFTVTSGCCCCLTLCPATLTLETEEAVFVRKTCCSTDNKRMPYGQLGSVDKQTSCGCCIGVKSNLTPSEGDMISPKCGCETGLVEEIVFELKERMKARGDTGNIKRAEQTIDLVQDVKTEVATLTAKIDAIMAHLNIPAPATMQR